MRSLALFWLLYVPLAVVASLAGAGPVAVLFPWSPDRSGTDAAGMGASAFGHLVLSFWSLLALFGVVLVVVSCVAGARAPVVRRRVIVGVVALAAVFAVMAATLDGL